MLRDRYPQLSAGAAVDDLMPELPDRTRRQIIGRLVKLGLATSAAEFRKPPSATGKKARKVRNADWSASDDAQLRRLFAEVADMHMCVELVASDMPDKSEAQVRQRLHELGLLTNGNTDLSGQPDRASLRACDISDGHGGAELLAAVRPYVCRLGRRVVAHIAQQLRDASRAAASSERLITVDGLDDADKVRSCAARGGLPRPTLTYGAGTASLRDGDARGAGIGGHHGRSDGRRRWPLAGAGRNRGDATADCCRHSVRGCASRRRGHHGWLGRRTLFPDAKGGRIDRTAGASANIQ